MKRTGLLLVFLPVFLFHPLPGRAEMELDYGTYLGGTSDDTAAAVSVDADSCAYVVGSTVSGDFPIKNAYQSSHIFHVKADCRFI